MVQTLKPFPFWFFEQFKTMNFINSNQKTIQEVQME